MGKKGPKMTAASDPAVHKLRQVGRWEVHAKGVDMSTLAAFLSVHLGAKMVDQTELQGGYDFQLN